MYIIIESLYLISNLTVELIKSFLFLLINYYYYYLLSDECKHNSWGENQGMIQVRPEPVSQQLLNLS